MLRRAIRYWFTNAVYRMLAANLTNLGSRVGNLRSKLNQSEYNGLVDELTDTTSDTDILVSGFSL